MIYKIEFAAYIEEIRQIYEFIKKFPEDYPSYFDWVEQCFEELDSGYKKAFFCESEYNGNIIGNLIFQKHKQDPTILEMKNGRIEPKYRRKKIFTDMYYELERYARDEGFKRIIGDCHESNISVIKTLESLGFTPDSIETIYDSKTKEIIFKKDL